MEIKDLIEQLRLACNGFYYGDFDRPGGELAVEIEEILDKYESKE